MHVVDDTRSPGLGPPDCFGDLNLDRVVESVTASRERSELEPVLHLPPHEADRCAWSVVGATWVYPAETRIALILDRFQNLYYGPAPMESFADEAAVLRDNGLQVTAQRLAVLRAVSRRPHSTAAEIDALVREEIGTVSLQAVYDTLAILTDRGIVRRIQPSGSPARYEDRVGDNHHHLICRTCGRTVDVDCAVGDAPCLTTANDSGYEIEEAEVVYWGRCPDCVAAINRQPTE